MMEERGQVVGERQNLWAFSFKNRDEIHSTINSRRLFICCND